MASFACPACLVPSLCSHHFSRTPCTGSSFHLQACTPSAKAANKSFPVALDFPYSVARVVTQAHDDETYFNWSRWFHWLRPSICNRRLSTNAQPEHRISLWHTGRQYPWLFLHWIPVGAIGYTHIHRHRYPRLFGCRCSWWVYHLLRLRQ